jgi:MFS family permease
MFTLFTMYYVQTNIENSVFYSTSYVSGSAGMMREFGIDSQTTVTLGMTTYMMGLATGPLVLAPMSELYGRRPVYLISLFLFFMFVLPACVAKNFVTVLVVRFFAYVYLCTCLFFLYTRIFLTGIVHLSVQSQFRMPQDHSVTYSMKINAL